MVFRGWSEKKRMKGSVFCLLSGWEFVKTVAQNTTASRHTEQFSLRTDHTQPNYRLLVPRFIRSSRVSQDILHKWLKSHCCCVHCGAQEIEQSWIRAVTGSVSLTWYITWEGTETTSLAWWVWGRNGTRCEQGLSSNYPHKSRGLEQMLCVRRRRGEDFFPPAARQNSFSWALLGLAGEQHCPLTLLDFYSVSIP